MFADVSDHMNVEDVRERYLDASYDLIWPKGGGARTIRRSPRMAGEVPSPGRTIHRLVETSAAIV